MYITQHKTDQEKGESLIPSNLFYAHLNLLPLPLIPPPPPPSSSITVSARRCESVVWDAVLGLCLCSVSCATCSKVVGVAVLAANRVDCVTAYVNKVLSITNAGVIL